MMTLGVFTNIYPDGLMTLPRALLISAVGFLIVFLILGVTALFVKLIGTVFGRLQKPVGVLTAQSVELAGTHQPVTASQGSLTLENVSDEEAAVIMAIVSDKSGIPLNRLQFNSIRLLEEE